MANRVFSKTTLALSVLAVAGLSACGQSSAPATSASGASAAASATAAAGKTLVYCSEASPEGFDPGMYTSGSTFDASGHAIYNPLVSFINGTTDVEPALAEKWDISEDGLT